MLDDDIRLSKYRGYWAATWREDGQTKRQSLRTKDRAEALRRLEQWKQVNVAAVVTIGDIVPMYLEERRVKSSYVRMCDAWKRLRPHFGALHIADLEGQLGRRQSRAYAAVRSKRGIQAGTIRRELAVLRAALRWHEPQTRTVIELPSAPPPRERYLTHAETAALINAASWLPHLQLFIQLGYYTAARKSAILGLTWDRVDFERGQINLNDGINHGNKRRAIVPIADELLEPLRAAQERAEGPHVVEYAGHKVASIRHSFTTAVERAGLSDDVTPHVLRHTAAVHMVEAGVPITAVGQLLGHTDSSITYSTYGRFSPDYQRSSVNALRLNRPEPEDTALEQCPGSIQVRSRKVQG